MKKIFLVVMITGFSSLLAVGQVTIQSSIPAVGMMQKAQLWNLQLSNNSRSSYDCRLGLVLRDRITGQEVMTAASGLFTLQPGVKQVRENTIAPVQYNYLTQGVNNRLNGLLPAGAYTVCFSLTAVGVKETSLAEECVSFDVEPLSPPILIFPADSAVLDNDPPQLSWMPPSPAGMFEKLHYQVTITEVKQGQTAAEALQENLPVFSDAYVMNNSIAYPASANRLEKDKWYAWQVVAADDNNYAAKTETWAFKITGNGKKITPSNGSYIFINGGVSENKVFYITGRELFIKYQSFAKVSVVEIAIKTMEGNAVQTMKEQTGFGDNFLKIKLSDAVTLGEMYQAEIKGADNRTYSVVFSISK